MAKFTHDVVATTGEYTDRQSGEKKKIYTKVGAAFTDEQGRISIKLDLVPVGPDWSGWLSLYEPKPRDGEQRQQTGRTVQPRPAPRPSQQTRQQQQRHTDDFGDGPITDGGDGSEIPF